MCRVVGRVWGGLQQPGDGRATKDEAAGPPDHSSSLKGTLMTRKRQETLLAMAPRAGAGTTDWGALGWRKPKVTQLS